MTPARLFASAFALLLSVSLVAQLPVPERVRQTAGGVGIGTKRALAQLRVLERSLETARRRYEGDHGAVLTFLLGVGVRLIELARFEEALARYEEALAMSTRLHDGDHATTARCLTDSAYCLAELGRLDQALAREQAALAMRQRLFPGDHDRVVVCLDQVGCCLDSVGRYSEALQHFDAALAMHGRLHGADHPDTAITLGNKAASLQQMGRGPEAIAVREKVLALHERRYRGDHAIVATSISNLGFALESVGRSTDALARHEAALAMRERLYDGDHPSIAIGLNNIAGIMLMHGRTEEALRRFSAALAMDERLYDGNHPSIARGLDNVGFCLSAVGRPPEGLVKHQAALAMRKNLYAGDHPDLATSIANLAVWHMNHGSEFEAAANLDAALAMRRRIHGAVHPSIAFTASGIARFQLNRGQAERAVTLAEEACAIIEQLRAGAGSFVEGDRSDYWAELKRTGPFRVATRAHIRLGSTDTALEYHEKSLARGLLDLMARSNVDLVGEARASARRRDDKRLIAELAESAREEASRAAAVSRAEAALRSAMGRRGGSTDSDKALVAGRRTALVDARASYFAAARSRARLVAGEVDFGRPAGAVEMQRMLRGDERFVTWSIDEKDIAVFVVPPEGQEIRAVISGVGADDLGRLVDELRDSVVIEGRAARTGRPARRPGKATRGAPVIAWQLFEALFPPDVRAELQGAARVYIAPSGALHRLPFEALVVAQPKPTGVPAYWLDAYPPVAYSASGTLFLRSRERKSQRPARQIAQRVLALGWADFSSEAPADARQGTPAQATARRSEAAAFGKLARLPGTRREVMSVFRSFAGEDYSPSAAARHGDVKILLGRDANESAVYEHALGARYLHLATHYLGYETDAASYSALALTPPSEPTPIDDGFLRVVDLLSDRWRRRLSSCELAVLSACETRVGPAQRDEAPLAMPMALFYAGVPACVVSQWKVDDASTAELMADFYRRVIARDGKDKLEALHEARRALKKAYPQPYHWAPFVFVGDPR